MSKHKVEPPTSDVDLSKLPYERVPIDSIHEDPANLNEHDEESYRRIAASIKEFQQVEPLVVYRPTRKVIGGNGRLTVMHRMGFKDVDVSWFDGTPMQAIMLGIALNHSARAARQNDEGMFLALREMAEQGYDLGPTGYDDSGLAALAASLPAKFEGEIVTNIDGEWEGMPEFEHDDLEPHRKITMSFASDKDAVAFGKLIGQKVVPGTVALWHPAREHRKHAGKKWKKGQSDE